MDDALGLMCVHAHPDDEAIATGGVLSRYADEGKRTTVVTCTGGELGEVVGDGMDPQTVGPRLGEVRRAELRRALEILGAEGPRFLGYRDSGMMGTAGNDDPASFWRADFDEAVGRLVAEIRAFRPAVLVTYDAFGGYGHPDHIQSHRVATVAAEAASFAPLYEDAGAPWRVEKVYLATIPKGVIARANRLLSEAGLASPFGEFGDPSEVPMGVDDAFVTTQVDVRPWLRRKRDALAAHYSQLGPESFFLNMAEEFHEFVFGTEWFIRHRSDTVTPAREDDLFAGLT